MTKKHFVALAESMKVARPMAAEFINLGETRFAAAKVQWKVDVYAIANACKQFNAQFDEIKFINSCIEGK